MLRWSSVEVVVTGVGKVFPLRTGAAEKSKFPGVPALHCVLMLTAFLGRYMHFCRLRFDLVILDQCLFRRNDNEMWLDTQAVACGAT